MMIKALRLILPVLLCMLTVFLLSACKKATDNSIGSQPPAETNGIGTSASEGSNTQKQPPSTDSTVEKENSGGNVIYTTANDYVTAKIEVNLRESATTNSDTVAVLKNGSFLRRTGIASNGWSRLDYNGTAVYAITSYLTTDRNYLPPKIETETENDGFVPIGGRVTAKEITNLRSEPSEKGALIATIENGEFAERVAESPRGWTRLLYDGKTVYAKTSLLTTELRGDGPYINTENFTPADGRVTAKLSETNLRTGPTTVGTEIVYTLKKGEFVKVTGERNGWTRISYNGQTVYAISSYLITEEEYNAEQNR